MAVLLLAAAVGQVNVANVEAETANAPSLVISQLKMTSSNGQFITLYNASNSTLDMSKYQLEYFNSYDLTKATSSKLISLTGIVPPHGYFMVNDSALLLCYQLSVDSVSLGLSSTAGMAEVLSYSQSSPGGSTTPLLQDYVSWSKAAAAGAQTLPSNTSAFLQRQPVDSNNNPIIGTPGVGSWQSVQPSSTNACNLVSSNTSAPTQTGLNLLLPSTEPPATIIGQVENSSSAPATGSLPDSDVGLMAPMITEALPNPVGSGNDAVDEYIEFYNPNTVSFDLSGFSLQVGTTTLHNFSFSAGTSLPPQSFTTFYSDTTHLSLSNSGGQIKLLDPSGNTLSTTGVYGSANDGQAWALANGKWYWTSETTPGEPNVIIQPVVKKTAKSKSTSSKSATAKTASKTKKTTTKAAAVKKPKKAKTASSLSRSTAAAITTITPIRTTTLAVIVGLALLYGAYEYRADLANRFHRLKRNLGFGGGSGQ